MKQEPAAPGRRVAMLIAALCLVWIVVLGNRAVAHATRPYDLDQFRDIAAAQSFVDGRGLEDPAYAGETLWYNPLLPGGIAGMSVLTGRDVPWLYVHAGPYLDALPLVAFVAMVWAFFGSWPAVIALASIVFLPPPTDPAWSTPTYSPWLFPSTLALGFFYTGLVIALASLRRPGTASWIGCGAWLGMTFLAHTAPALILAICLSIAIVSAPRRADRLRAWGFAAACVFGTAILVAAPFLWSIVWHYKLHVLNAVPNRWDWTPIDAGNMAVQARTWLTLWNLPVFVGAFLVARTVRSSPAARLCAGWGLAAAALLAYGWSSRTAWGARLPPLVPEFHFYLYLRALSHVLFAVGSWSLLTGLSKLAVRGWPRLRPHAQTLAAVASVLLIASIVQTNLTALRSRPAFGADRMTALTFTVEEQASSIRERLRAQVSEDAVVLATPMDSLLLVAPSGRRVIALPGEFSNPYVSFEPRASRQTRMLQSLDAGAIDDFVREARKAPPVAAVLLRENETTKIAALRRLSPAVVELSHQGGIFLFSITNEPTLTRGR